MKTLRDSKGLILRGSPANEWSGDNHQKRKEQSKVCEDCAGLFITKHPVKSKDGRWRCVNCNNNKRTSEFQRKRSCSVTPLQYEELFKLQAGVCAICRQPEWRLNTKKNGVRSLCVDHDHETGKVRGLLCGSCNSAIAWLKEDTRALLSARSYLLKHKERQSWDHHFLELAIVVGSRSKDPSTKVGAVIVRPDKTVAGQGFNGFPPKMPDKPEYLTDRTKKYARTVHSEINALNTCRDHNLDGYTIYSTFKPCDRCFVQLASRGISRFVFPKPTDDELTRWGDSFKLTTELAADMNIPLIEIEQL
jgi:dCMP deaminase